MFYISYYEQGGENSVVMVLGFIHDLLGKDNFYFSLIVLHILFHVVL